MLKRKVELAGIEDTVCRPIIVRAVKDINQLLDMERDIFTLYTTALEDKLRKKKNRLGLLKVDNQIYDEFITIEIDETVSENEEMSMLILNPDFKSIYIDNEIGANFTPLYLNRKTTLTYRYYSKSKNMVEMLINKIRQFPSRDSMYIRHDFGYFYNIPDHVLYLLDNINKLKNKRMKHPLTLGEYVTKTFDDRVDLTNTLDGDAEKSNLVIRESQTDLIGYLTGSLADIKMEYDEENTSWYVELEYSFDYEKPVSLILEYPIMVFNNLIDSRYREFTKVNKVNPNAYRTHRISDMHRLTQYRSPFGIRDDSYYLTIPEYDALVLKPPANMYVRLMSIMVKLEDDCLFHLFNIHDIPKYKIKDSILDFIINSEREYVGDIFKSFFFFELYKNGVKDYGNSIVMDKDGNLSSVEPMDIKAIYRVTLSIIPELAYLTFPAQKRIRDCILKEDALFRKSKKKSKPLTEREFNVVYNQEDSRSRTFDGIEFYNRDSFIDIYMNILNIHHDDIYNAVITTPRIDELVFRIMKPIYSSYFTKERHINIAGLLEER